MAGSPWSNQVVSLIVLTEQTTGFSGLFGYSPTVGPGNLIFSLSASAGTDPYGNAYPQGLNLGAGAITGINFVADGTNGGIFIYSGTPANGNLIGSWAGQSGTDAYGNAYPQGINVTTGAISGTTFSGTDFIINSSGAFFYSGTPGTGNLASSSAPAAGTDSFGNNYVAGQATYGSTFAAGLAAGLVAFYTGSLSGGWTLGAQIETDSSGDLLLLATSGHQVITANNTLDNGTGGATVAGILAVNGSGMTVGDGSNASFTLNPKMATPPNAAAVAAGTATLAQLNAFCNGLYTSMKNRGMFN